MGTAMRVRKVSSKKEFDETVDDFITQGYKVVSEGEKTVQLKRSQWGTASMHVLIFLFLGWWTLGIGNLIYALIANGSSEQVIVKVAGKSREPDDAD